MAEYGNRCITDVRFPFHSDNHPSSRTMRRHTLNNEPESSPSLAIDNVPDDAACDERMGDTCNNSVNRDNGAVTVLATHPAIPPAIIVFSPCENVSRVVGRSSDEETVAMAHEIIDG